MLAGVGVLLVWISRTPARHAVGWTAICLFFGAALVVADERSTFVFDPGRRLLQWRRDSISRLCRRQLHQMRRASDLIARVMFAGGALAKFRTRPGSAGRPS